MSEGVAATQECGTVRGYRRGGRCVGCRAAQADYRRGRSEKDRAYREANRERIAARKAAYQKANRDRIREYELKRLERLGPEYVKAQRARFAELHPSYSVKQVREWRKRNPERRREQARAESARRRAADPEAARQVSRSAHARRQASTVVAASKRGQQWTGVEMQIATERDSVGRYVRTAETAALLLGRTTGAVALIRHKCLHEPKYIQAVGNASRLTQRKSTPATRQASGGVTD